MKVETAWVSPPQAIGGLDHLGTQNAMSAVWLECVYRIECTGCGNAANSPVLISATI